MKKNNYHLSITKYLTFVLSVVLVTGISYSSQLFHTIQTASFRNVEDAQKQYDSIEQQLEESERDHLRIEKIGKFYSVRLGKFSDADSAKKFFEAVKAHLPQATVMTAYIKDERIVRLFGSSSLAEKEGVEDYIIATPEPEKTEPLITEKVDTREQKATLKENLTAIAELADKKDFMAALEIIEAEIALAPEHPDLNAWRGMVLLKMDQPMEALKYLTKAVNLSPKVPDYHNGLGYSLYFMNKFDKAIDAFNKAVKLDPGYFDALTGLCISYAKSGNKENALDVYNKIKGFDRDISDKLLRVIEMDYVASGRM